MSSNNPFSDPSTGSNLQAQQATKGSEPAKNPFDNPNLGLEPSRSAGDYVRDAGAWGLKAALAVPETAVGLADLATGGKAGKALENEGGSFGLRFKQAREVANDLHSDAYKQKQQQFDQAEGIVQKGKVALQNPSLIAGGIVESLGLMGAGGVVGRGALAATRLGQMGVKGAAIAGAAGEGVVGAGSAAEQIRQQTDDGLLTGKQAGLAAATGLATGAIGFAGNKVANRLGIGDADMMLAMGTKGMAKDAAERATAAAVNPLAAPAQKSILRQMGEGAIAEGVLEELPQSVSEQILQNEALGKSWSEGLDEAVVMGILSGGAMGAGAAGYRGFTDKKIRDEAKAQQDAQQAAGAAAGDSVQAAGTPWTTSAGAAGEVQPGTAPASEANAPNLDYETMPGAAAESAGNEIPFDRDFDTGGLSLQSTGPVADAPVLDHEDLRDKSGLVMPPQLDTGRIEVDTGIAPLSNETPARQWDTGNLSLLGDEQPQAPLSQRMGLNPNAGALSKAAVMAVDSGASSVTQPQLAPEQGQAPVQQQAAPEVPAGVDPDTGEITLQAQIEEIKSRIAYMQQQGAAQGWNKEMVAQRNALQTQLTKLEVQGAKEQKQGASTTSAPAPVELTGINQILAKKVPDMSANDLQQAIAHYGPSHKRTKKLEKALQALAQKPLIATETGAKNNDAQTPQAQQGSSQPTQARAAQASAPAAQGVSAHATPAQYDGAQAGAPTAAKSPAPRTQAAPAEKVEAAQAIAQKGNAQREQERQRQQDASERWTRMTTAERQAVAAVAPGLNVIARKNLHTRAWADIGEKSRAKLVDSLVNPSAGIADKAPVAIKNEAKAQSDATSGQAQGMADAKSFAPESGTLGIPRADMPQVPTASHGGLVKHLNAQGIAHETKTVDAADLKPTQAEYSPAKVEAAKSATGDRAVIVSSDGHIIYGHHQAVAAAEEGKQVKAIVLDAPVEQALEAVKASPSANLVQAAKSEVHSDADGLKDDQRRSIENSEPVHGEAFGKSATGWREAVQRRVGKWGLIDNSVDNAGRVTLLKGQELRHFYYRSGNPDDQARAMAAAEAWAKEDGKKSAPKSADKVEAPTAATERSAGVMEKPVSQEQVDTSEFPMSEAIQSYSGISHSGRSRADGDKQAFDKFMKGAQAAGEAMAETDAQREALGAAVEQLRADYLQQYRSLMNARASTYSGFVAGRGNLNSKQANARNNALDKAMERFDGWVGDNVDRVSKAVLAARTPEQVKADRDATAAKAKEKADKKAAALKATLLKLLSFKSGDNMPYGKSAIITRVSYDRDGYPSSLTFKMADGSPVTDDKLDLVPTLKDKDETLEQAKARIRALVAEVRAENPELNKGVGAMRAAVSAKAQKESQAQAPAPDTDPVPASYLDRHNAIEDGINAGTLELDGYKSAFAELEANQDAVMAELNKLTKAQLLKAGGAMFTYRMKDDKKDAIALAAYQKMLDTYALGRSYGPSSYFLSAASIAKNKADKAQALRELVSNTTAEDLAARAAEIKAARDEVKAQRDAAAEALANPKSLQDFRGFMRHWMDRGESMNQSYLRLSPEQRQQYDALEAAQSKDAREVAKRRAQVSVASAGNTTAGEVIATKHTKHGYDLFVVQLADRVERDAYDTLNSSAKRMGGSYSSFRGNGAVPGFQFRTREAAEAFQKLVAGDTAQAQELADTRRDAFDDDKSQSAAERLRTMAEALEERATEALGAERKVNTARRARFAASADAAARSQQALAGTMRNISQAIDAGTTQFLDGVRQRVQVEYLMGQLRTAKSNQLQAKYPDYGERMKRQGEPMDAETVDFAAFPTYEMYRSDWASLARQLLALDGGKKLGATLARHADDVTEAYTDWAKENLLRVSHFGNKVQGGFAQFASKDAAERAIKRSGLSGKAVVLPIKRGQNRVILSPSEAMQQGLWQGDGDKRMSIGAEFIEDLVKLGKRKGSKALALPWQLESAYENRQRLQRMGILTRAEFRSALRELASLQQEMPTPDRIKELERSMVGRANDGLDFFPTSPAVVQSMLDAAEIAEGMAVLEPSAGMGHIADAIVEETGVWPDVVELSGSRRELLEAKGFHLAEVDDFTQMEPRRFFTFGDTFRAPDGVEGVMRGVGGMGSQRVRLEDAEGNRLGLYDRSELVGVAQNGTWSGYDRIIMNPPFSDGRDIQHVQHAYDLLKPGGRIVAIMGEGAFFQSNKRAEAFRDWLDERGATNEKLPDGSFMDPSLPVNTGVAARMVVIDKPAGDMQLAPRAEEADSANYEGAAQRRPASAQDKAVMQAIADGKSARDVLRVTASGSKDPFLRQVARMLLKTGITPNIEFGHIGLHKGNPIHGQYRGQSDTIAIAGSAEYAAERIFMHEAMHAATMRALAKPGLIRLQLQKLAAHVRKQPGAAGFYGISDKNGNVDEFVAEAFTNPDFQTALRKINAPTGSTIKTAWDGFVRILRSILGLPNDSTNALSQALQLGVAAMREDMALRQQGARSSGSAEMVEASRDLQRARILQGEPVAVLSLEDAPTGGYTDIARWAATLFAQQGGKAVSPDIGEVTLNEQSARDSMAHGGANAAKKIAFAAVKDVIERGTLVYQARHGRLDSFYVSAPVRISGRDNIVTALVHRDQNTQRMYLHSVALKENLLKPSVSAVDAKASELGSATTSGDRATVAKAKDQGKAASSDVARELNRLLTLDTSDNHVANFGADDFTRIKTSALDQLSKTFTHAGKVSLWDKSVGTMRHLAERAPAFKPVYEAASQNIDDVSMLANDAANLAPRILPRVETLGDLKKKPVSVADNKAVAKPLFEGTLIWARDENGKPALVDDLQKRYANLSVHNKAAMLLKHGKIDAGVLAMWQGLPAAQFEKHINSRFESKLLKAGIVWSDSELKSQFSATDNQISLYRETRAAIDRSIDMTARTDMLRVVGDKYEAMREAVLDQPSVESAAQLLLDTLEQDAKADPDSADRLGLYMQQIKSRMETAADLQKSGYAPLSRFGRYTVDVVDANGERQYFGMYETVRESNLAKMQLAQEFKGATVTTGTMSAEAYKLFAGVTPETLEQFGEMLGLKAEGNEAQDKAFQEFLKLTKNNHSAMKRMIHRKGIAGFSEDIGRVVANFVYSNARAGAMGLNAGKMDKAINEIPKEQGELKDLAMGLRSYIRDPQEEGQAVRGMLFAQYLGGSIASAFVNTTQPFAVTLPWLSQYGGMKKAGAQLARALKDMATKGHQYEADLAKALQSAEDDGVVSPQEIHQLMAQARGAGMLRSGDGTKAGDARAKAGNLWEQGKVLWGQPFALAEQFNRRSTFIAAYRTAKEQGIANPAEFARQAVLETQFVYTKANKPRWARGAVGGTLFTFKTYSVSYLELMQRMWTQGGPEGKRAVGWALAMLVLMGGAGGVPFMEDAEDLIDGAGQLMGYNISAKQWRKELLASVVGKELADFMEQGVSGLPGAPIDVSGRLGMGNLLPGTGLFLNKPNRERDLMEMVGPAGDLVARGFTGARKLLGGDVAGAALEVSPTAVRNLAKGADMAATGMYRDNKGYKVIDTTLAEAAAKAIGFQPKTVAEVQEANSFMQRSKSFYIQTSSEIMAQWADALFRKDEVALERVRERLADWNRDNPEQPIVVKMPDVWKRVREMGKDRSDRIADTAPKALREQMRELAASRG